MTTFKTGDKVLITVGKRVVQGNVMLASPNGKSLMLEFEAILGGFVGRMPVLMNDEGAFHDIATWEPIGLEKAP